VTLPLLRNFGIDGAVMAVKRRGSFPNGGGLVELKFPVMREIKPINVTDAGLIARVRGVAFCAKVSPTIVTRVIESARSVLNRLLPGASPSPPSQLTYLHVTPLNILLFLCLFRSPLRSIVHIMPTHDS